jgi:hypothetical protein
MSSLIPIEDKRELVRILKKLKYMPPTGHGKIHAEIDIRKDDILMIEVTTKNLPESEEEAKYTKRDK